MFGIEVLSPKEDTTRHICFAMRTIDCMASIQEVTVAVDRSCLCRIEITNEACRKEVSQFERELKV